MSRTITQGDPLAALAPADAGAADPPPWRPAVDVAREDDRIVLRADLPGVAPQDISVDVEDGMLTLSGAPEETARDAGRQWLWRERRVGAFARTLPLPDGVDPSAITASTRDGVLEVVVPLPATSPTPATIPTDER